MPDPSEVRNKVLLQSQAGVDLFVFLDEPFINFSFGFPHFGKDHIGNMFRCHLKLPAYMTGAGFLSNPFHLVYRDVLQRYRPKEWKAGLCLQEPS